MKKLLLIIFLFFACVLKGGNKISPSLLNSPDSVVNVIVALNYLPQFSIAQSVGTKYKGEFKRIRIRVNNILRKYYKESPNLKGNPPQLNESDKRRLQKLLKLREKLITKERNEIADSIRATLNNHYKSIEREITELGGSVRYSYLTLSALSASIPKDSLNKLARDSAIAYIFPDRILSPHLAISTHAMGVDAFWGNGFRGGVYDVGILDTGVDVHHPALQDATWIQGVFHATAQTSPDYRDNPNSPDDLVGHGTHVAGIVLSTGSSGWENYKGVAYGTTYSNSAYCFNMKAGWLDNENGGQMSLSDAMAAIDWAITYPGDGVDVINISFGGCTSDDEDFYTRFIDAVVDVWHVTVTISAGNYEVFEPCTRYIESPGTSYNSITVGAIDDHRTIDRSNDEIVSWSAIGPTTGGRRKPDIGAPGVNIHSANYNWENSSDFIGESGTSMAAPHVAGAALLLMNAGIPQDPKIIKALLLRNSDPKGPNYYPGLSWNYQIGWGYINLDKVWTHLNDYFEFYLRPKGQNGDYKLFVGHMNNGDRALTVWNRHVRYNGPHPPNNYYDLNNIDVKLYDLLSGNVVGEDVDVNDNVHEVTAPSDGDYLIRVYSQDVAFRGVSQEQIVLATPGNWKEVSGPSFYVNLRSREPMLPGRNTTLLVDVTNVGDIPAFDIDLNIHLPEGFQLVSGDTSPHIHRILNGEKYTNTLVVRTPSNTGTYQISSNIYSVSYNEAFSAADTQYVLVENNYNINHMEYVEGGSGYYSQNSQILNFGLANNSVVDTIFVDWPSGISMVITGNISLNGKMDINEPDLAAPYPVDVVDVGDTWIHLKWKDNSSDEDEFVIERSTSQDGPFSVVGSVGANDTSFVDAGLTSGTTYYYRVQAKMSGTGVVARSPYSVVVSGTPGSPPNSLTEVNYVEGGSGYYSQNSQILSFGLANNTVVDTIFIYWPSGIIDTLLNVNPNHRLAVIEGANQNQPPSNFSLLYPPNNGYVNLADTLDWEDAVDNHPLGDHVYYDVYISNDEAFSNPIVIDSLTSSKYPVSLIEWAKLISSKNVNRSADRFSDVKKMEKSKNLYYWKVKAYDLYGSSTWSNETWQFELDTVSPAVPTINRPQNGEWLSDSIIVFEWEFSGGKQFQLGSNDYREENKLKKYAHIVFEEKLQDVVNMGKVKSPVRFVLNIDTTMIFTSPVIIDTVSGTSDTLNLGENRYYWRVKAFDLAGNESYWSSIDSFGVDVTPPEAVSLISPEDSAVLNTSNVLFNWSEGVDTTSGVAGYWIELSEDSSFSGADSHLVSVSETTMALGDTIWYWRVKAVDNAGNEGDWSEVWSFTIDTGVPEIPALISPVGGQWLTDTVIELQWSKVNKLEGEMAVNRRLSRIRSKVICPHFLEKL